MYAIFYLLFKKFRFKLYFSPFVNSLGNSCIIHSSLVGLLNTVLVSSAYLGFINSGITPSVFVKFVEYSGNLNNKVLVFPGYLLYPFMSTGFINR